ncbi:MAG TPA: plastocyanin/azurin family copper-binding protein, partial [Actinomycetota bacterium]|nr:plastocyanin/azurin family copper-binding protein [Actinomycetota bacterium]
RIVDLAFRPRRVEVSRGTRVRWTNRGDLSHTTTSRTDAWDSGTLAPGDSFGRVFRSRGTFRYICSIHPDMRGKVIVT